MNRLKESKKADLRGFFLIVVIPTILIIFVVFYAWLGTQSVDKPEQKLEQIKNSLLLEETMDKFFDKYGEHLPTTNDSQLITWLESYFKSEGLYLHPRMGGNFFRPAPGMLCKNPGDWICTLQVSKGKKDVIRPDTVATYDRAHLLVSDGTVFRISMKVSLIE